MGSIFFRIYGGVVATSLLLALVTYVGVEKINDARLSTYVDQVARGTFSLIAEGAARHQGEKREQWIGIISRLTHLPLGIETPDSLGLRSKEQAELQTRGILVKPLRSTKLAEIYVAIPGEEQKYLAAQLSDINESLARTTSLLILNELGRRKKEERADALKQIQKRFGFPIARIAVQAAGLNDIQMGRIGHGDTVVVLRDAVSTEPVIQVYASFGNSGDLLELGPIPLFNWFPIQLLIAGGLFILFLMALASYLWVRPLEARLKRMVSEVNTLGNHSPIEPIQAKGNDAISGLATQINHMTGRINGLMETQRELTLAVSHELKTPIAKIKFRLTTLEDEVLNAQQASNSDDAVEALYGMNQDIQQLETLLKEMLSYASLEQQPRMHFQAFQLDQLLERLSAEQQLLHPDLEIVSTDDPMTVVADKLLIHRAIENLLSNACRHARSKIEIHFDHTHGHYAILVEDDGDGIPEGKEEKIFAPFYRVDSSRNRHSGGSGLGLAIVSKIIQWHKGTVNVERSSLGGARFKVSWPVENHPETKIDNIEKSA